jgi:hypothetical protein
MMRIVVLILLFALATSRATTAQNAFHDFMICPFLAFNRCAPLSDAALQDRGVSDEERRIIETLKQIASAPDDALFKQIAPLFGAPQQPYAPADFVAVWFPSRGDDGDQPKCPGCGLRLLLYKDALIQINYGVQGKFTFIWNNPPK